MNKTTYICQSLNEVRNNIDEIDNQIIKLIAQRSHFVDEASNFKKTMCDVTDSKRVKDHICKIKEMAKQHDLDQNLAEQVFRGIINAFIKQEICKVNPVYENLKKSYY